MAEILKTSPFAIKEKTLSRPYGISSRVKFNLQIIKKDGDSFILPPFGKTKKEFRDGDIVSVEGLSRVSAIAQGYIHIIR